MACLSFLFATEIETAKYLLTNFLFANQISSTQMFYMQKHHSDVQVSGLTLVLQLREKMAGKYF